VEKIDTIISTIQGQLPAKIIFTTTSTDLPKEKGLKLRTDSLSLKTE